MKIMKFAFQVFTILVDISGILLSLCSQESFDNAKIKLAIRLCQAFRTELILLLLALFCIFYFIPFLYRHFRETDSYNKLLCMSAVVATLIFCFPLGLRYAKARYYYFNNNIIESYAQFGALEKGTNYLKKGEFDLALNELNLAKEFSVSSRFDNIIDIYKEEIKANVETSGYIFENFVKNNGNLEDKLDKLQICAKLNPLRYGYMYSSLTSEIETAIENYPRLYHSVQMNDFKTSQDLVREYGDIWFERIIKERLLHTNEQFVMRLFREYLDNEDCNTAQDRLRVKYFNL